MVPFFVLYMLYVQATCVVALVLLLLGFELSPATLCEHYLTVLRTQYGHSPGSQKVLDDTKGPVLFLSNHRSWGDFWVDCALLGGTSFVSRWLVAVAIPVSGLWGWLQGWIWFFTRGKKRAEGTTKWMANFFRTSHTGFPDKGLVMYPEGTRTLLPQGLPLKHGGLVVAHSLGWPLQIVITTNKEGVIAERTGSVGVGTRINTCVSKPLKPQDYAVVDDFIAAVESTWKSTWQEAYNGVSAPRPAALLPGAVHRPSALSFPMSARLNGARLVAALLVLMYVLLRAR